MGRFLLLLILIRSLIVDHIKEVLQWLVFGLPIIIFLIFFLNPQQNKSQLIEIFFILLTQSQRADTLPQKLNGLIGDWTIIENIQIRAGNEFELQTTINFGQAIRVVIAPIFEGSQVIFEDCVVDCVCAFIQIDHKFKLCSFR